MSITQFRLPINDVQVKIVRVRVKYSPVLFTLQTGEIDRGRLTKPTVTPGQAHILLSTAIVSAPHLEQAARRRNYGNIMLAEVSCMPTAHSCTRHTHAHDTEPLELHQLIYWGQPYTIISFSLTAHRIFR